uniref:Uncharacterized protein n=1 Tax=Candidatus Kentrum sp. DK TaxID=2126562 RepID=A0A450SVS6_9GAMM|nr:MAG: hypothetical protein BECKDK2373B_GA0170837_106916 [Candidatus Kentron sp. DK]
MQTRFYGVSGIQSRLPVSSTHRRSSFPDLKWETYCSEISTCSPVFGFLPMRGS